MRNMQQRSRQNKFQNFHKVTHRQSSETPFSQQRQQNNTPLQSSTRQIHTFIWFFKRIRQGQWSTRSQLSQQHTTSQSIRASRQRNARPSHHQALQVNARQQRQGSSKNIHNQGQRYNSQRLCRPNKGHYHEHYQYRTTRRSPRQVHQGNFRQHSTSRLPRRQGCLIFVTNSLCSQELYQDYSKEQQTMRSHQLPRRNQL